MALLPMVGVATKMQKIFTGASKLLLLENCAKFFQSLSFLLLPGIVQDSS
jgi:hypothetical protein